MIRLAICDDNVEQMHEIKSMCKIYSEKKRIPFYYIEFFSGEQVLDYQDDIDILLLDIGLPGISGLSVMKMAEERINIKRIVFVSAHYKYACEGYSSKTRGFIRKPVFYEELEKCFNRVINEIIKKRLISFKIDGKSILLHADEILYLYSIGNYIKMICLDEREYIIYGSMAEWNKKLMYYGIVRVHKSFMVNLKYIDYWDKKLKIRNGDMEIPVGKKFFEDGKRFYEDYYFDERKI